MDKAQQTFDKIAAFNAAEWAQYFGKMKDGAKGIFNKAKNMYQSATKEGLKGDITLPNGTNVPHPNTAAGRYNKAKSWVKANPWKAAGGALTAAGVGGLALRKSNKEENQ